MLPRFMFEAFFFGGIIVLIAGGVQYQVSRKQRSNFNDQMYIEDSKSGDDDRAGRVHVLLPLRATVCCPTACRQQHAV